MYFKLIQCTVFNIPQSHWDVHVYSHDYAILYFYNTYYRLIEEDEISDDKNGGRRATTLLLGMEIILLFKYCIATM